MKEELEPDWKLIGTIDKNMVKDIRPGLENIFNLTLEIVNKIVTDKKEILWYTDEPSKNLLKVFCKEFTNYAKEYNFDKVIKEAGFNEFDIDENGLYLYNEYGNMISILSLYYDFEEGESSSGISGRDSKSGPAEIHGNYVWYLSIEFDNDIFIKGMAPKNKEIIYKFKDNY